jgi:hypothetical protein
MNLFKRYLIFLGHKAHQGDSIEIDHACDSYLSSIDNRLIVMNSTYCLNALWLKFT